MNVRFPSDCLDLLQDTLIRGYIQQQVEQNIYAIYPSGNLALNFYWKPQRLEIKVYKSKPSKGGKDYGSSPSGSFNLSGHSQFHQLSFGSTQDLQTVSPSEEEDNQLVGYQGRPIDLYTKAMFNKSSLPAINSFIARIIKMLALVIQRLFGTTQEITNKLKEGVEKGIDDSYNPNQLLKSDLKKEHQHVDVAQPQQKRGLRMGI